MTITINGTSGIVNDATDLNYTGTLTGGTGVVNLGSGQVYKDASGNVGIGTSSPTNKLDVRDVTGVIKLTSTTGTNEVYSTYKNTGGDFYIGRDNSTGSIFGTTAPYASVFYATGAYPMVFFTNATERARIDSSGNLLVGTTSAQSGVSGGGANILTLKTSGNQWGVGPTVTYGNFYIINSANTGVYLGSGNTAWSAQSDERTKDIIEPITNAANKVSLLRAVIGKYKTDAEGTRRPFLMAQDFQVALPEAVDVQEDEQGTLGLRYTDTIPLLVAAIQEQQTIIVSLQDTLTALTARITALEGAAA